MIDDRSSRVLVPAASIASMSMNRVAACARVEAEKKVPESALARKEAIDYVTSLSPRVFTVGVGGGVKRRKTEVSGAGAGVAVKAPLVPVRLEKNGGVGRVGVNNVAPTTWVGVRTPEVKNVDVSNSSNEPIGSGGGGSSLESNVNNNGGNSNNRVGVVSDRKDGTLTRVK